ncbi:MAG: hypothetical protein NTW01_00050 [Gammaproteobacteria bacterium]|nr:hypothetical protein [Gammaproteobacteria bacterium]
MKVIKQLHLVQYFLYEKSTFDFRHVTAFTGGNGVGKSALLDAVQIAILGAHGNYLNMNAQASEGKQTTRSVRGYCLGIYAPSDPGAKLRVKRSSANTFITLVGEDTETGVPFSFGVALTAVESENDHRIAGLYVVPNVALKLEDHIERLQGGEAPKLWDTFSMDLRRMAAAAGVTPEIENQPTKYVKSVLYLLGGKYGKIRDKMFLKAFRKSMGIGGVTSVDDFVRDFIVEEQPVTRGGAVKQIEEFNRLEDLIAKVIKKIGSLEELRRKFDRIQRLVRENVALSVQEKNYDVERIGEKIGDLEDSIERAEKSVKAGELDLARMRNRITEIGTRMEQIQEHLVTDDAARLKREEERNLQPLTKLRSERSSRMAAAFLNLRQPIANIQASIYVQAHAKELDAAYNQLDDAIKQVEIDDSGLNAAIDRATAVLAAAKKTIDAALVQARSALEVATARRKTAEGNFKNAEQGKAPLQDSTVLARRILEEHGIAATPVFEFLEVIDPSWQPAMEGFLGSNCEALIVRPDLINEANKVFEEEFRKLPKNVRPYKAKIVQPKHFSRDMERVPERNEIASLLRGKGEYGDVARGYAMLQFNRMVMVKTVQDLQTFPRSMKIDGQFSANGSTSWVRLVDPERSQIGAAPRVIDMDQYQRDLLLAQQAEGLANADFERIEEVQRLILRAPNSEELKTEIAALMPDLLDAIRHVNECQARIDSIDTTKTQHLEKELEGLKTTKGEIEDEREKTSGLIGGLESNIATFRSSKTGLENERLSVNEQIHLLRMNNPGIDQDAETIRARFDGDPLLTTLSKKIEACKAKHQANLTSVDNAIPVALDQFRTFLDNYDYDLLEERTDWKKAMAFTSQEYDLLHGTRLAEYRQQSERARHAAEEAFRTDVATKIVEAVEEMRRSMRDLNRILRECPEFSNGDRYEFKAEVVPEHADLLRYIMTAVDGVGGLFAERSEASEKVMNYIASSARGDAPQKGNPIEDYREMFRFDVQIFRHNEKMCLLSSRFGSASGGEHKAPMYIILAAALHHAYRLGDQNGTGGALMLVDEAFEKIDEQNSIAITKFLTGLGLQVIMSAADVKHTQLTGVADRVYSLTKVTDTRIHSSYVDTTSRLHDLLSSDLLALHPELIDQEEARLTAATGTAEPAQA